MDTLENGYSLLTIATAMLLTGFIVLGGMYLIRNYDLIPTTVQTTPTVQNENILHTIQQPSSKEIDPTKGIIEGTFNFPSEQIPSTLIPCAENTETKEIICSASLGESGQENSFMIIVPPGSYYVYAINSEDPTMYKAYYTEFVTCGLLASCPSHEKIAVQVASEQTVSDIKPHDWYDSSKQP
ncbi:MAG TPA: hypothetical protein PLS49_09285 [Candidatus Woesebacteria bacterium]|nr:hypothetical protein [Candidatus Woesebacteria bacterium]